MRDLKNNLSPAVSIDADNRVASVNGDGVDLRDFDSAAVVFHGNDGDFTTTDESYIPKVQESDDDVTYTDVAADDQEGLLSDLRLTELQTVGYKGNKRYIRAVLTLAGTTPIIDCSALVLRGHPHQAPVS